MYFVQYKCAREISTGTDLSAKIFKVAGIDNYARMIVKINAKNMSLHQLQKVD